MTRDLIRGRPVTMSDFRLTEQPFPAGIASGRHLGKPGVVDGPLWVDCGGLGEAPWMSALKRSAHIPPVDLHIPVLGQLAPAQLPLGDALEPGPLEIVGLHALFGGGPLRE